MAFDFPEERQGTTPNDKEPAIEIPSVLCTVQQLEEVNRAASAYNIALASLVRRLYLRVMDIQPEQFDATLKQMVDSTHQYLDAKLQDNIARVAGPKREDQVKYLQEHPEAILFSGDFAGK